MAPERRPTKSTLYVFDGDSMYLAELELSPALQGMLAMPIGDGRRWLAWAGVLTALKSMVDRA